MNTVTARNLSPVFLAMLRNEFNFLTHVRFQEHRSDRPVTFRVQRSLSIDTSWELIYGRINNEVTDLYTNGVTTIWLVSREAKVEKIELREGQTKVQDVIKEDTYMILVEKTYRSLLVYADEGYVDYTLYKVVPTWEIFAREAEIAAAMAYLLK